MAISAADIWRVADELDGEGIRPTLAAVRKRLGSGSFTTISEAITEWKTRKQADARPRQEPVPAAVTERLAEAGSGVWAIALAHANARLEEDRKTVETEKQAMAERLAEAVEMADNLTLENETLRGRVAQLESVERERDKIADQLTEVKRRSGEELARCMEKANRSDSQAMDAHKEAKAANENAARLQGQVEALKEQVANFTAALKTSGQKPAGKQP